MNKNRYLLLLLFTTFISCTEWDSEIHYQKIEDSPLILYKYDAWGGRDTHIFGFAILDSTQEPNVSNFKELPIWLLREIPNKNFIKGISNEKPGNDSKTYKDTNPIYTPISENITKQDGIKIENLKYQYKGYNKRNGGFWKLYFSEFVETRDSIYFYKLKKYHPKSEYKLPFDTLKFKKTNVIISDSKEKIVNYIWVDDVIVSDIEKEFISEKSYQLIPTEDIKTNEFSDYGIFKKLK